VGIPELPVQARNFNWPPVEEVNNSFVSLKSNPILPVTTSGDPCSLNATLQYVFPHLKQLGLTLIRGRVLLTYFWMHYGSASAAKWQIYPGQLPSLKKAVLTACRNCTAFSIC
jgi:hypothetical protein